MLSGGISLAEGLAEKYNQAANAEKTQFCQRASEYRKFFAAGSVYSCALSSSELFTISVVNGKIYHKYNIHIREKALNFESQTFHYFINSSPTFLEGGVSGGAINFKIPFERAGKKFLNVYEIVTSKDLSEVANYRLPNPILDSVKYWSDSGVQKIYGSEDALPSFRAQARREYREQSRNDGRVGKIYEADPVPVFKRTLQLKYLGMSSAEVGAIEQGACIKEPPNMLQEMVFRGPKGLRLSDC
jgi:hypothetical protein